VVDKWGWGDGSGCGMDEWEKERGPDGLNYMAFHTESLGVGEESAL
jgi:hypothetical protein